MNDNGQINLKVLVYGICTLCKSAVLGSCNMYYATVDIETQTEANKCKTQGIARLAGKINETTWTG